MGSLDHFICSCQRLLCLSGRAKRDEHGAKRVGNYFHFFTLAYWLLPAAYLHLITLSALANTVGGMVSPISLAVFRLITSSNLVGCSTGNSAGFVPFKILST